MDIPFTPAEQRLITLWEQHVRLECADRDAAATVNTMSDDNHVNHVPTMTGGVGRDQLKRFYKYHFIGANPDDTRLIPISRTVGANSLVDEMLFCFTHDREIDWMLPGVEPTGRYVEVPLVAIVGFRGDKIWQAHREHFYQRAVQAGRSHAAVVGRVLLADLALIALAIVAADGAVLIGLALAAATIALLLADLSRPPKPAAP